MQLKADQGFAAALRNFICKMPDAPPKDPQALQEARYREARKKMEVLLEEMRRGVSTVPEDKQQKYKADLKALESEKEAVSKVVSDLEAGLDTVPKDDRVAVKAKLREEAWQPTKDAIGVCSHARQVL